MYFEIIKNRKGARNAHRRTYRIRVKEGFFFFSRAQIVEKTKQTHTGYVLKI